MNADEKTVSEREARERERKAWDARNVWGLGRLNQMPRADIPKESDAARESLYPSIPVTPKAERITLSDGRMWHYDPQVNRRYPWKDAFGELWTGPELHVADVYQSSGHPLTAADYDAIAACIRRYNAQFSTPSSQGRA